VKWRTEFVLDAITQTLEDEEWLKAWRLILIASKFNLYKNNSLQECHDKMIETDTFSRIYLGLVERIEQDALDSKEEHYLEKLIPIFQSIREDVRLQITGHEVLDAKLFQDDHIIELVCMVLPTLEVATQVHIKVEPE